jgi:hypothetical protein
MVLLIGIRLRDVPVGLRWLVYKTGNLITVYTDCLPVRAPDVYLGAILVILVKNYLRNIYILIGIEKYVN